MPAATPPPSGSFVHATSWGGTLLVAIFGAALLLIAPWLTRGVVTAGCWLARSLLGPGTLTQRVRDLEQARARGVDDLAALLRQVERDLHDGAQVQAGRDGDEPGHGQGEARRGRPGSGRPGTGRGAGPGTRRRRPPGRQGGPGRAARTGPRQPPARAGGRPGEALATLAAGSAIPVRVTAGLPARPTPAIEAIACFGAAELLANAARHSGAGKIGIRADITGSERAPVLAPASAATAGAAPSCRGQRPARARPGVGTVDGRLTGGLPYRPKSGLGRIGNWYRLTFRG